MLDLSEEKDEENIATCVKYFTRMAAIDQWLEMEIGKKQQQQRIKSRNRKREHVLF